MKEIQYYLVDIDNIKNTLDKESFLDQNRMKGSLDLLIINIENNIFNILNDNKILFELDHKNKTASLMGEELNTSNWKVIYDKEKNTESVYNSILDAIRESTNTDGGENMIKEIKSKK